MDFGLSFVIFLFAEGLEWLMNRSERSQAKEDTLDIQHDAQEENARQAKIEREWQERFWKENQSPEALMNQYRNLGASDSAALMSALGVSPSVASGASASTGPAGGLGAGVSTISDLMNSVSGGFKNFMEGDKAHQEAKWTGPLSQAQIDKSLGDLAVHWKEFGLQEKTFYDISKPLAEMSLNKTRQDIAESMSRIDEINEKILLMDQQINESKQNVVESQARVDLYGEQVNTEVAKQGNLNADTQGQLIENQLNSLSLALSKELGFDIRLSMDNKFGHIIMTIGKRLSDKISDSQNQSQQVNEHHSVPWSQASKAIDKTFDTLLSTNYFSGMAKYSLQKSFDYINSHTGHSASYDSLKRRINSNRKKYERDFGKKYGF